MPSLQGARPKAARPLISDPLNQTLNTLNQISNYEA
ncbi:hypothetical protein FHS21_002976 [Phyllobacterium trifolii]|uniref:Uncharacterized protein n=1 Tax=Phyllobacterium trifolii TaxID=300193 RepID=A0A839UD03_9HYPH|nr:hypothetical protein [Phyllobacterium trifolii]